MKTTLPAETKGRPATQNLVEKERVQRTTEEIYQDVEAQRGKILQERATEKAALEQRIQTMMDGKEPIPNSVIKYLLDELKGTGAERIAVTRSTKQAEQMLQFCQKRMIELTSIHEKFIDDIGKQLEALPKKTDHLAPVN